MPVRKRTTSKKIPKPANGSSQEQEEERKVYNLIKQAPEFKLNDFESIAVTVTPVMASLMLKCNVGNRPVKDDYVNRYVTDMRDGNFTANGNAVVFADDGTLIDGQKRLLAITISGKSIKMIIVTGVPRNAQTNMDGNEKRTLAQQLGMLSKAESNRASAIIVREQRRRDGIIDSRITRDANKKSMSQNINLYHEQEELINKVVRYPSPKRGYPDSVIDFFRYLTIQIDGNLSEEFIATLLDDNTHLPDGHPILAARRRISSIRTTNAQNSSRDTAFQILYVLAAAWNLCMNYQAKTVIKLSTQLPELVSPEPGRTELFPKSED
jgi:hypothetical protein